MSDMDGRDEVREIQTELLKLISQQATIDQEKKRARETLVLPPSSLVLPDGLEA